MKRLIITVIITAWFIGSWAQKLTPGFCKSEYLELLKLTVYTNISDTSKVKEKPPLPQKFHRIYRSPAIGLDNLWDLWISSDSLVALSIRGSTSKPESWVENFFSVMVPAKGSLHIADDFIFNYTLAENPQAAVHTGWLIGMAFVSQDMLPRIDSLYRLGYRNFYIVGYSQGGAIAYLLTAYFYNLQKQGKLPADIRFKTYCNAAPKPGNLFFAYEYEHQTHGWAFNVVNAADWVPQSPLTIQTPMDMSPDNPLSSPDGFGEKRKFPFNLWISYVYRQTYQPIYRAQANYRKYFGRKMVRQVKKYLPQFIAPEFVKTVDYSRVGQYIILYPDSQYYKLFPIIAENVWLHHGPKAYFYLAEKLPDKDCHNK
jgi:hypothetical protein